MFGLIFLCIIAVTAAYQGSNVDPVLHIQRQGFDRDPKTFAHEIVAPWLRPFKPGYCDSWEWHTDERYKEERLRVCRELSGGRKHECNSANGYCRDKCPFTNGSYPFWRIRNADSVPYLWTLRTVQMFETANARYTLHSDPVKAYASTYFGPGYYASNAFDNNPESIWVSNGESTPGLNWIAYEFDRPVKVGSIRIQGEEEHKDRLPLQFYVEASCEKYFKTYASQWLIENHDRNTDKRHNKPRQQRWR